MEQALILSGVRTPIGSFLGALAPLSAPRLGAFAIAEAVKRAGIAASEVDEVLMGCVLQGGMGQAPARQAALGAGLPASVPCTTINKVCGSGMKAVMLAAQAIIAGDAKYVLAGGMESMSNSPYSLPKARSGLRMGDAQLQDLMIHDGLWDPYGDVHMGTCGDQSAAQYGIDRARLDAYAAESYARALDAQSRGALADEIVPVVVPQRKGEPALVEEDEEPKRGDAGKLASLKPAFGAGGVTTAGNASSISDGAAALVVATESAVSLPNVAPLGRIVAYAQVAAEPNQFPTAPKLAIEKLLDRKGLRPDDIDLFEVNEAFSVVPLIAMDALGISREKMNVNGGAVSLGHPIGMTGARLVLTAAIELRRRGGRYAVASPCIGGGEATAVLIERC